MTPLLLHPELCVSGCRYQSECHKLEQGGVELVLRYDSLILSTWNCHDFDRYKLTNFCPVLK